MSRPYHPDEIVDAREAGSAYAQPANAAMTGKMQPKYTNDAALPVAEGVVAIEDLHRQLDNLRAEADTLRTRLAPVLAVAPAEGARASEAFGTGSSVVCAEIREATQKAALVRGILSEIHERYQF